MFPKKDHRTNWPIGIKLDDLRRAADPAADHQSRNEE